MKLIMQDFVKTQDRLAILDLIIDDFSDYECTGCGQKYNEITVSERWHNADHKESVTSSSYNN